VCGCTEWLKSDYFIDITWSPLLFGVTPCNIWKWRVFNNVKRMTSFFIHTCTCSHALSKIACNVFDIFSVSNYHNTNNITFISISDQSYSSEGQKLIVLSINTYNLFFFFSLSLSYIYNTKFLSLFSFNLFHKTLLFMFLKELLLI
jgi:hypothetical protein